MGGMSRWRRHQSERPRLMAMGKPLRTRGEMTSRGGGRSASTFALPRLIRWLTRDCHRQRRASRRAPLLCLQRQSTDSVDPFFGLGGDPYKQESFNGGKMVYFL